MTRRTSFGKRVEQAMLDLLGVAWGRRRDITPSVNDPLPVGVAARLALITGATDPAILTGGLRRGTEEDQKARLVRLQRAATAPLPDLEESIGLPVRCGGRLHGVVLRPDDTILLASHPGVDPVSEQVAAALGAPLLPCVAAMAGATASWAPPVADDGPRIGRIEAGELLAFAASYRSWLRHGFDLTEAASAVELGIGHGDVVQHLALGLSLPEAAAWVFVPADEAVRWRALGFGPEDGRIWLGQGRTLDEAEAAATGVDDGRWLARWARVAGRGVDHRALAEWAMLGLPVGVWGEVASRGVLADQARAWLAAGFTSVEVLRYAHLRVEIREALQWRDQGFTAFVAAGCLGVGMTLADACALRGLPAREIQDAWRECGSVDGVRRALVPS